MAMHRTQLFIPTDMHDWLRDEANGRYINVSMVVRELIRNEMAKRAEKGRKRVKRFLAERDADKDALARKKKAWAEE